MGSPAPGSIAHEVYLLRVYDQLTYKAIAERLNVTVGVVAGHARRLKITKPRVYGQKKKVRAERRVKDAPNGHPLVRELIAEMNRQKKGVTALCVEVNISPGTFAHWRNKHNPELPTIEACFNVLGLTLRPVPIDAGK
jgi:hypothetical protein